MTTKYLDKSLIKKIDDLPDKAIIELLAYIYEKREVKISHFLNEESLHKILNEDNEVLQKLAE
jgi:hypothetical protein